MLPAGMDPMLYANLQTCSHDLLLSSNSLNIVCSDSVQLSPTGEPPGRLLGRGRQEEAGKACCQELQKDRAAAADCQWLAGMREEKTLVLHNLT